GQLYRSDGATYPNETARDASGRMSQLHTWRDATGNSDITRWYYDPYTGAVTSKVYADGKGTEYTYLSDGRMATREWASGVTTTYGYTDTAIGSTRIIDYSDTTPSITNTYNLVGQLTKVEDGSGTTIFGYDSRGRQIAEINAFAIITRSYDTYGRYSQFVLNPAYPGYPCLTIQYGYDVFNRLNTITAIVGSETNTFTYSYLPGTQLISGYIATTPSVGTTNIIVSRSYELYRNLISAITNSVGSVPSVVSSFNYHNDSTGKRTSRIDFYNGSTVTNTFDYNIRNEVTNAVMNLDVQNIVYDDIGNREQSTVHSGQSAATNTYTANQLNQYTSVNSGGSARNLTHDDDGNLTCDGAQWHHAYDGENRLVSSSNFTSGVLCDYAYDYQSRRISKTTLTPNPYSSLTTKYIWNGFNITAEIIIDHVTPATNINYYTWGLDLSSTLQGAGGVGGLLSDTKITNSGTNTYFSVGDANGNITEYVDVPGTTAAHGEHNAFGETKLAGAMKEQFTHWFSTKPFDKETGFVVYQRRYYDPILCRWLSIDPVGIKGGLSEVGFVNNDAINLFDAYGLYTLGNAKAQLEKDGVDKLGKRSVGGGPYAPSIYELFYTDKQIFDQWVALEMADTGWLSSIPNCPDKICIENGQPKNCNNNQWNSLSSASQTFHPGASWCMRSNTSSGSGQQCCYDKQGHLITSGLGAGTPDRQAASIRSGFYLSHYQHDVAPFNIAWDLDGGVLGQNLSKYFTVRPPSQGKGRCYK
ncbi:MAG: RHS repeat-associated core domain-containing protein, partial [Kiritimatiellia bacterium]